MSGVYSPFTKLVSSPLSKPFNTKVATLRNGGSPSIPALAVKDRATNYILDRSGNYIVSRV